MELSIIQAKNTSTMFINNLLLIRLIEFIFNDYGYYHEYRESDLLIIIFQIWGW
jgi:hypothetical protein